MAPQNNHRIPNHKKTLRTRKSNPNSTFIKHTKKNDSKLHSKSIKSQQLLTLNSTRKKNGQSSNHEYWITKSSHFECPLNVSNENFNFTLLMIRRLSGKNSPNSLVIIVWNFWGFLWKILVGICGKFRWNIGDFYWMIFNEFSLKNDSKIPTWVFWRVLSFKSYSEELKKAQL